LITLVGALLAVHAGQDDDIIAARHKCDQPRIMMARWGLHCDQQVQALAFDQRRKAAGDQMTYTALQFEAYY
jgi:hypothetical protein